ncbi:MAG: GNAT family N-acyltransferase [Chthoniobacteraceae bacterium]
MNSVSTPSVRPASRRATYRLRLATSAADLDAAQRLRFAVFNLELGEGLVASHVTGRDEDAFDAYCDHLLVEQEASGEIVGTYRLQTGQLAAAQLGYYSEQEFDFAPFESLRCELVELGRACVAREHRHMGVLSLLWRGIANYALERKARYLIGCSSLTSQDHEVGAASYEYFRRGGFLAEDRFLTTPTPAFRCPMERVATDCPPPPKLLRTYLSMGAKLCGPPAIDREFGTIDFLTLLDLQSLTDAAKVHFGIGNDER